MYRDGRNHRKERIAFKRGERHLQKLCQELSGTGAVQFYGLAKFSLVFSVGESPNCQPQPSLCHCKKYFQLLDQDNFSKNCFQRFNPLK